MRALEDTREWMVCLLGDFSPFDFLGSTTKGEIWFGSLIGGAGVPGLMLTDNEALQHRLCARGMMRGLERLDCEGGYPARSACFPWPCHQFHASKHHISS